MDDDISDLIGASDRGAAQRKATLQQSAQFAIDGLPSVEHAGYGRPWAIGKGFVVKTNDGDKLFLANLFQYRTNAGVLAGFPSVREDNFLWAVEYARAKFPDHDAPPFVVPPTLHRGRARSVRDCIESFEDWCVLPPITSFGVFTADREAKGSDEANSSVLLIWYQDNWGVPDDPRTLRLIAELDWDKYAHNWGW